MMTTPILATKLHIPARRADLVPRPRLVRKLAEGLAKPLVLISAPAGFGKTTLLSEWIASLEPESYEQIQNQRVVWLSLEPEENDPVRFLHCLAAALESLEPGIRAEVPGLSAAGGPANPRESLAGLLQRLNGLAEPFVLVLEDYHLIGEAAIHDIVAYLIGHMPPRMRLILSSRSDPPLPLARWRVQGDLTEIRAEELRFTLEETGAYLTRNMGLALSGAEIEALAWRTEGWVAGLKLAALSLLGEPQANFAAFVADFAGSHRYIADYLIEEVLNGQPAPARDFLLETSVLSILCGTLCDAVTGRQNGQLMLERLDQENLFIVPLDDDRLWFRYHHLFAELLRHRLDRLYPGLAPELQRRAVAWFQQNELLDCAIETALTAGEFELAAGLIERFSSTLRASGQTATLAHWLQALPRRVIGVHPNLAALLPALTGSPLTLRELEVLSLLGQGASNREIAQSLVVSLGTVKKHLNNIFTKLEVESRTQAVARARELGLL